MRHPSETRSIAFTFGCAAAAIAGLEVLRAIALPRLPVWQSAAFSVVVVAVVTAIAARVASRRMRVLAEAAAGAAAARRRAESSLEASERFTGALMEHSSDLIAILDPDGTIRFASPSHERTLGYPLSELVGRKALDFVHPDDRMTVLETFARGIETPGLGVSLEFRFRHRDGTWRVVDAVARAAPDDPVIAGAVVCSRDVTALRAAQREEVEVAAALARLGRELIAQIDRGALLDRLCRLTTEVLGCDVSRTLLLDKEGATYAAVAGFGDAPERWEAIRALRIPRASIDTHLHAFAAGDVVELDADRLPVPADASLAVAGERARRALVMALRRGSELVGVHSARFRDRAEPCTRAQVRIARGLAQLASLALENARLVEELDRAHGVKSDFVASMSHELRTPLNVIIGYADLLADHMFGDLGPEQAETVRRISEQGRELLEMVNTTLDLSRLDSGRVPLALEEVDLVGLLAEIELEAQLVPKNPALAVSWQVAADLAPLWTDPLKLKVIVKNLLLNALKFTDEGSVIVSAATRDDGVEIAVDDTGIGIAPELVTVIFDAFRQADHPGGRSRGGVGLGLHIVRRLLEMLGGTIAVESEVGRGSTFRVWVPSQRPVAAAAARRAAAHGA
jgi:PAS domain S-box-containing protein